MNPFKPSLQLLCKLGSIAIHARELCSPDGHVFDKRVLDALLEEPEVKCWLEEMDAAALLPRERVRDGKEVVILAGGTNDITLKDGEFVQTKSQIPRGSICD